MIPSTCARRGIDGNGREGWGDRGMVRYPFDVTACKIALSGTMMISASFLVFLLILRQWFYFILHRSSPLYVFLGNRLMCVAREVRGREGGVDVWCGVKKM